VQQEMLDHVMRRAKEEVQGGRNAAGGNPAAAIVPHCSDARDLPFDDGVFDAVYLVTALGEMPEPAQVLSAAARAEPGVPGPVPALRHGADPDQLQ